MHGVGASIHTILPDRMECKTVRLISSYPFIVSSFFSFAAVLQNCVCLSGIEMTNSLRQKLTGILSLSFTQQAISEAFFLFPAFHLSALFSP